ncbi:MAG: hypothetical protein ACP5N2_06250 [Candidatus Nanoarchaeia archaeon]
MRKKNVAEKLFTYIVFSVVILVTFVSIVGFVSSYNYEFVNVTTRVNITNAYPEIMSMMVGDPSEFNVTLNAGSTRLVQCNATIRDWNGYNDIANVNATLFDSRNLSSDLDDNNTHYTNSNCVEASNDGQYFADYTCNFSILYYANNGSWTCNLSVIDNFDFTDSDTNTTMINALYALNVTDLIDYGNLSVTDYSENITAVVTNYGNKDINVSVLGYGLNEGDGLGFVCEYGDNISIEYQRFSVSPADEWGDKTPLSASNQDMSTTLLQQQAEGIAVTQATYWQLYVPPNPFGLCTGTIRFTATLP